MSGKKEGDWGIYVGNIPHLMTKEDIVNIFQKYNIVHAGEIICRGAKTFCFLQLRGEADVNNAVAQVNGCNVNGRKLKVKQLENRSALPQKESEFNSDAKFKRSSLVVEGIPPLETPLQNQISNNLCNAVALESSSRMPYSNHKFHPPGFNPQNVSCSSKYISKTSPEASTLNYGNSYPSDHFVSHTPLVSESNHHSPCSALNKMSHLSSSEKKIMPSPPGHNVKTSQQIQGTSFKPSSDSEELSSSSSHQSTSSLLQSCLTPQKSSLEHNLCEPLEKYRHVHCTRNVISYNPRDLPNSKADCESLPHLSEAIKVWAANFPYGTSKNEIKELFEDFHPLRIQINNNSPGRNFTRATIILPSLDLAEAAIMELDNTIYKKRTLLVGLIDDDDEFEYYEDERYKEECFDEEYYDDEYHEPDDNYYEETYLHGPPKQNQFYEEPISRRFHNIHFS